MTATTARTLCAVQLLALLRPYDPIVEGAELVFASDPPEDLWPMAAILQTGLRAALTNRRWFGIDTDGRGCGPHPDRGNGPLAFGALDTAKPIPRAVRLLTVEGEPRWDRIRTVAYLDFAELFIPKKRPMIPTNLVTGSFSKPRSPT